MPNQLRMLNTEYYLELLHRQQAIEKWVYCLAENEGMDLDKSELGYH